ncbi:hypothetical protein INR49_013704 [Caranx melampygus]|nr:hypothetical protein INR49_013704 [Caranx melampygus]
MQTASAPSWNHLRGGGANRVQTNIKEYRDSFSCEKFTFRSNPNITFYVYVSNFSWPIKIQIAFSQHNSIMDLVQFFVTFFSWTETLNLLSVSAFGGSSGVEDQTDLLGFSTERMLEESAGRCLQVEPVIFEKDKVTCLGNVFRVIQQSTTYAGLNFPLSHSPSARLHSSEGLNVQLMRERQQMASRPFASVAVALDARGEQTELLQPMVDGVPKPVAMEPCSGGKAAVLTVLVRLPSGPSGLPPPGQSGLIVASALIDISQQKPTDFKDKSQAFKNRKALPPAHQGTSTSIVTNLTLGCPSWKMALSVVLNHRLSGTTVHSFFLSITQTETQRRAYGFGFETSLGLASLIKPLKLYKGLCFMASMALRHSPCASGPVTAVKLLSLPATHCLIVRYLVLQEYSFRHCSLAFTQSRRAEREAAPLSPFKVMVHPVDPTGRRIPTLGLSPVAKTTSREPAGVLWTFLENHK